MRYLLHFSNAFVSVFTFFEFFETPKARSCVLLVHRTYLVCVHGRHIDLSPVIAYYSRNRSVLLRLFCRFPTALVSHVHFLGSRPSDSWLCTGTTAGSWTYWALVHEFSRAI